MNSPKQTEQHDHSISSETRVAKNLLGRLYNRVMAMSGHRHAMGVLAGVSLIESSVFPIPPDVMMIPMVLSKPRRAFWIATVCTIASVVGGLLGYFIGYGLWQALGEPLMAMYGYDEMFAQFAEKYNRWGAWIVFTAGITPFPYKVITIASGLFLLLHRSCREDFVFLSLQVYYIGLVTPSALTLKATLESLQFCL